VPDVSPSFPSTSHEEPSSLVVVPVLNEDTAVVMATLRAAASHAAVGLVLAVTGDHEETNRALSAGTNEFGARLRVLPQQRLGILRPGKGDAINTGLTFFLQETALERIHFYDADIKTFDGDWITKAETALDLGFDSVRHFYPRAATDAMITWMVTRLGFAQLWPASSLPRFEQPLSGELAFNRQGAAVIAADPVVRTQSDWGIDTAITFATVAHGLSIYESYIARGKDHALYGSLADIKVMMVECLIALQRLRSSTEGVFPTAQHVAEPQESVSIQIAQQIGFDVEATQHLLAFDWNSRQEGLLATHFPDDVAQRAALWREWPDTSWMDEETWAATLAILIDHLVPDDEDWASLAFRLWVGRVLHYTLRVAVRGHAFAAAYLHEMVERAVARCNSSG
jgi:mannosylglycerate synthase